MHIHSQVGHHDSGPSSSQSKIQRTGMGNDGAGCDVNTEGTGDGGVGY